MFGPRSRRRRRRRRSQSSPQRRACHETVARPLRPFVTPADPHPSPREGPPREYSHGGYFRPYCKMWLPALGVHEGVQYGV